MAENEWRDNSEDSAGDEWVDDTPPGTGGLVKKKPQGSHKNEMQQRVLLGIGGVFGLTLVGLLIAVSFKGITESFALELARLILPAALAAGATVVGTLFTSSNRGSGSE